MSLLVTILLQNMYFDVMEYLESQFPSASPEVVCCRQLGVELRRCGAVAEVPSLAIGGELGCPAAVGIS